MDDSKPRHPNEVRTAINDHGISQAGLAREAGVHKNTLRNVQDEGWSPNWKTLQALCQAAERLIAAK